MALIKADVHSVRPLTDSILQVTLCPDEFRSYHAGQYLQIVHEQQAYPFSIANAPLGSHKLELHIRHSKVNPYNDALLQAIKDNGVVMIEYPMGNCSVNQLHQKKPLILIAGGTGFSPIKAVIEQLLSEGDTRRMHLFWGAKSKSDLYMEDLLQQWQTHVDHFKYTPILSSSHELIQTVIDQCTDLLDCQIIAAGAFDMVYRARDTFVDLGLDSQWMFSDAFEFEG